MPQVTPYDCVPILLNKANELTTFVYQQKGEITDGYSNNALWQLTAELLEQVHNVAGPPKMGSPAKALIQRLVS